MPQIVEPVTTPMENTMLLFLPFFMAICAIAKFAGTGDKTAKK